MNCYGSHTYSFINGENERVWVGVTNPASPTDCFKRP
jgi:catalase